jgi:hypothetical protein
MHIKSIYIPTRQRCYIFPYKPYTLAGFEPVSFFPQANAMTTAPRRQIKVQHLLIIDRLHNSDFKAIYYYCIVQWPV